MLLSNISVLTPQRKHRYSGTLRQGTGVEQKFGYFIILIFVML